MGNHALNEHLINLAGTRYWAFVMFALVVYIPLSGGWLRPWMSAVLNLLFLRMYITGIQFWAVVATVIAVFTISKLLIRDRLRTAAFVLLALPTAALFALHKS